MKKCLQQVKLLFSVLAKLAIWVDILHFLNRCSWAQNICFKFLIQNTGTCKLFWFFLCNFLACTRRICLRPIELMFGSTHLNDSHENWILQGWPCCGGVIPGRDQVRIHHFLLSFTYIWRSRIFLVWFGGVLHPKDRRKSWPKAFYRFYWVTQ